MNSLDILFLVLIAAFAVVGLKRGLVAEFFRLIALLGGFIAAYLGYGIVLRRFTLAWIPPNIRTAIAFVTVFLGTAAILLLLGWVVKKLVHLVMLGWLDRLLGACVGAAKSLVVVWVVVLTLSVLPGKGTAKVCSDSTFCALVHRAPLALAFPPARRLRRYKRHMVNAPAEHLDKARKRIEAFRTRARSLTAPGRGDSLILSTKERP
jgi:membrane protein required for colicin V production